MNIEETKHKYMLLSCHQNPGQNRFMKAANRSFANVPWFKYLGTTVTYQNLIQEEIKRRLNSGNVCYHQIQNLLSVLLSAVKNIKNWNMKDLILPVVLYRHENLNMTFRKKS
jgi:hypothetical protein